MMMVKLWGVPAPYPDELYWGYLGRARRNLGLLYARMSNRWFYGSDNITATTDLLGFVQTLCEQLSLERGLTAATLLQQHTLFPYYLAFANTDRKKQVIDQAISHSVHGLHQRLNVSIGYVKPPQYLRYCRLCWQEQMDRSGEVYLQRLFQLPGVWLCPRHRCPLGNTDVRYRHIHSTEYLCLTMANALEECDIPGLDEWADALADIASNTQKLLDCPLNSGEGQLDQRYQYRLALRYMGLAKPAINVATFESSFLSQYPMQLLSFLGLSFTPGKTHHWLREIIRSPRRHLHPLQHLLFRRFVEAELGADCWSVLGHEHWPCLSPLTPHPVGSLVMPLRLTYERPRDQWQGLFQCTCGFRFTAKGRGRPSPDSLEVGKVVGYGASVERWVRVACKPGFSKYFVAKSIGLDWDVVNRIAHGDRQDRRSCHMRWNPEHDRQAWLHLRQRNPSAALKELRSMACALYNRLYLHDRDWLKQHQPDRLPRKCCKRSLKWDERDGQLAPIVDQEVTRLLGLRPFVRITMTAIGRYLGIVTLLKQRRECLPKTNRLLNSRCENVEQFQTRRLHILIIEAGIIPGQLTSRSLMRIAGLSHITIRPAAALIVQLYCDPSSCINR